MSSITIKRLTKELSKLQSGEDKVDGINIDVPIDLMEWHATIKGPSDSPFEGGIYKLILKFDSTYPIKPPSIKFVTPMFHPNIYRDGKICLDVIQSSEWSPSQNIRTILISIVSLLTDPNPNSPANRDAAVLYTNNREEYNNKVKEYMHK